MFRQCLADYLYIVKSIFTMTRNIFAILMQENSFATKFFKDLDSISRSSSKYEASNNIIKVFKSTVFTDLFEWTIFTKTKKKKTYEL